MTSARCERRTFSASSAPSEAIRKYPPVVHRARAHAQVKFEVGNKSSDLVSGRFAEARATRDLEQRVCIFLVPVDGERSRLRPGWRSELSADSERRSHLRDWLSACDVLRSGLNRLSAHTERRSGLRRVSACELRSDLRGLSAHTERRSGLQRVSACDLRSDLRRMNAHTERRSGLRRVSACDLRSDLRRVSAQTELRSGVRRVSAYELRSDLRRRMHGTSLELKRRGYVQCRCGARLQRSRHHHSTRDARCAL